MISIPAEIISSIVTPIVLSKIGKTIAKKVIAKSAEEVIEKTITNPKSSPITPIISSLPLILKKKKSQPPETTLPKPTKNPTLTNNMSQERVCSVLSYTYGLTKDKRILEAMIDRGCITEEEAKDLETLE